MGGLLPALALAALSLSPCHIEGLAEEVLCGSHRVFEDRAARRGRTLDLQVAVVPALRGEKADDPLFLLAGGPGQGATKYGPLIPAAFREVRKTRDIVLVDLRGTGGSNPLGCSIGDMGDPLELLEEGTFDASACLRGLKGDPRHYTTAPAVDDLDEVRAALGYERINLWGGSYGTRAALVYAWRHPGRVRTVVLDGAAPFEIALPLYNAWGAQRALDRLLADCAAEPACRSAYPRLRQDLDEVLSRLPVRASLRHPQTGRPLETTVTRGGFASGLRGMLYTPAHASLLPWVVRSARQGDFAPFATLTLETAAWSTETMSLGMTLSVLCSEDVHRIRDDQAESAVRGTFLGDFEIESWRRMCERWPRGPMPAVDGPPLPVPALILSGDLDPVTPPRWGEVMKRHFSNALHVIVPGTAHNTSLSGCVPDLIARFVERKPMDASCVRAIRRPPFVIDPSGTAP